MLDKKILRNFTYGMYLLGAKDDRNVGFIADAAMQISGNPITIAVSVNKDNYTHDIIKNTGIFSISILGENENPDLIRRFGYESSKDIDKYENTNYKEVENVPVLNNCCGYLVCKLVGSMDANTHTVFLGEVITADGKNNDKPMSYTYYHEVLKGKSPSTAPTFVEDQEEVIIKSDNNTKKTIWHCAVCGYEIEIDELPDDFICPWCKKGKEVFTKKEI